MFYEQAFYIFGGKSDYTIAEIARLDVLQREWSLAGSLLKPRSSHAVVFDGENFLIIGGQTIWYGHETENCILSDDTFVCSAHESDELENSLGSFMGFDSSWFSDDDLESFEFPSSI